MRRAMCVGAAVMALALGQGGPAAAQDAGTASLEDFTLKSGQDLVDLCAVDSGHALYADAKMFCFGVIEGIVQYHDAVGRGPDGDFIVCPEGEFTREDTVEIFVDWGKANPDQAKNTWAAEAVVLATLDAWGPCKP